MSAGRTINSQRSDWCTPNKYADAVQRMFGQVGLDPCSHMAALIDAKVKCLLPTDGLDVYWNANTIFVNPPYGADRVRGTTIKHWLEKCAEAASRGKEVLALVPVATNTRHWKEFVFPKAASICFLYDTRLKFRIDGSEDNKGAPMACAMVYWGKRAKRFASVFSEFGAVVELRIAEVETLT